MAKFKHHIHPTFLGIVFAVSLALAFTSAIKILAETSGDTTNCTVQCSSWSDCSSSGTQTKTCHPYPTTCPGDTETETRTCDYDPPTCTSFTYSSWSDCRSDGTQTRSITSKSPSGCTGGNPETEKTCNYVSCTIKCSDWSDCSTAGTQTKTCHPYPTTCPGETTTESRTCDYSAPSCNYTYTDWNKCNSDGMQYREIKSYSPAGCEGGNVADLKRHCTYSGNGSSSTDDTTASTQETNSTAVNNATANTAVPVDTNWTTNDNWKKENFGTEACPEEKCGGDADPDKDRLTNNDENRYNTDPLNPDTDSDGKLDGDEVANGTNPLKPAKPDEEDKMIYENPKEKGEIKKDIYSVAKIETVDLGDGKLGLKVSGKGPANSYITVYIYSGQPIIVTVKTDSNGDWTYTIDKELEDGDHEAYVAVTNNSGEIKAKSEPLPFVKTAQAVTVTRPAENPVQPTIKANSMINWKKLLQIFGFMVFAATIAFLSIGRAMSKVKGKVNENSQPM